MPVLLVRAREDAPPSVALRRILVPLDGSIAAEQALPAAVGLAAHARATIILLHAIEHSPKLTRAFVPSGSPVLIVRMSSEQGRAAQHLQQVAEQLHLPELHITSVAEPGYPAEVILSQAETLQADLIMMATHGRSGLLRWLLGSVTDQVRHAAAVPLPLVRAGAV